MESVSLSYYDNLLGDFIEAMKPQLGEEAFDSETHLLQFEAGEMVLRVLPHTFSEEELPEPDFIRLEAALFSLDLEDDQTNYRRFLFLHQFNSLSRLSSGLISFVDEVGILSLGKIVSLKDLSLDGFASELGYLIAVGKELFEAWEEMGNASQEEIGKEEESPTPSSPEVGEIAPLSQDLFGHLKEIA